MTEEFKHTFEGCPLFQKNRVKQKYPNPLGWERNGNRHAHVFWVKWKSPIMKPKYRY